MIEMTELSEYFVEAADTLVDDFDIVDFLSVLTERVAVVSSAAAVGIVLSDHHGRVRFIASSNEDGRMLELLQIEHEEGPCRDCLLTGVPVINADLAHAGDQWPVFAPRAIAAGYRSVHAFPMRLRTRVIGALNLFGTSDARFDDEEARVVQSLADVATIAILHERNLAQAEALTEQLQVALTSRVVIEQAKGALAQADKITTTAAFHLMREQARSSRRRLVDVAAEVLEGLGPESRG